jgi:S1-C subfamily serine protease
MNYFNQNEQKNIMIVLAVLLGLMVLHNQRLTMKDPENTYPKRIKRFIRLVLNPPSNKLEEQLIGKGIACEHSDRLYKSVAGATVVIKTDNSIGAGVFIGARLIATAEHVVDGKVIKVTLPSVKDEALAVPGDSIEVDKVYRTKGLDLAFITTKTPYASWLELESNFEGESDLLVVGHPNRKYYSLQKAKIRKRDMLSSSEYVLFKDNEVFFGNSGGAIVGCEGRLVGVVSMMSNYQNNRLKQGIGINSKTIALYAQKAGLN